MRDTVERLRVSGNTTCSLCRPSTCKVDPMVCFDDILVRYCPIQLCTHQRNYNSSWPVTELNVVCFWNLAPLRYSSTCHERTPSGPGKRVRTLQVAARHRDAWAGGGRQI